jgi:hypothetical protein
MISPPSVFTHLKRIADHGGREGEGQGGAGHGVRQRVTQHFPQAQGGRSLLIIRTLALE